MRFDYATAWRELAAPAYQQLPTEIYALLLQTADATTNVSQSHDLSMPWPTDGKLKAAFRAVDMPTLALSARVIYFAGHWFSGKHAAFDATFPGRQHGAHWKFSHYADQDLRERLNVSAESPRSGFGIQLIEGALRVCYSSVNLWTWAEVAPATPEGLTFAQGVVERLKGASGDVYTAFEALKATSAQYWPTETWVKFATVTDVFVTEGA